MRSADGPGGGKVILDRNGASGKGSSFYRDAQISEVLTRIGQR